MASNEDIDEFVTCGVCLWEYDEEIRKPKFLPCSHTVCLLCLQGIIRGTTVKSITCPFCRHYASRDTSNNKNWVLPNNTYALQMLKLNKQTAVPSSPVVAYPKMKNKNVDTLLKLKEELLKIRDTGMDKLALAIQKRKEVREHMELIIEAISVAGEEAKKFQDENNLSLAEMVSILEENESTVSSTKSAATVSLKGQKRDLVLSEIMSLVEDSANDDSVETLKQKMKKSNETYEQKLNEATAIASEYELRQKTKIQVHLYDEKDRPIPTLSVLENGFRFQPINSSLNGPLGRQDSKLLSHAVFFLLQRQKVSIKKEHPSITCNSKSSPFVDTPPIRNGTAVFAHTTNVPSTTLPSVQVKSLPPRISAISKKFVLEQSIFILKLYKSNMYQGEIHIRPSPAFHPTFVQQLGEFCYESPQKFYSSLDKAIPGVFVSFALTSPHDFRPAVPSMFDLSSRKTVVADVNTAIGIAMVESCVGNNVVTSWNFIIPLKDWHNPKCVVSHSILNNELFGRIIRSTTNGSVTIMSQASKSERATYTLTIETTQKSGMSERDWTFSL